MPPYAYVPGRRPHPTADTRGHSFNRPADADEGAGCLPAGQWRRCMPYLFGCDLYNHGYWWEAHEAWESIWLTSTDPVQRRYLQGLIQVANAHLKVEMGRSRAVQRLCTEYTRHLEQVGTQSYMGNRPASWLTAVRKYHAQVLTQPRLHHLPTDYPYLRLRAVRGGENNL